MAGTLRVWLVLDSIAGSGNRSTAEKLSRVLESPDSFLSSSTGDRVEPSTESLLRCETSLFDNKEVLQAACEAEREERLPSLVIAIHAIKSALPLVSSSHPLSKIPLVVLLSGTDMNADLEKKRPLLQEVFGSHQTRLVVAISSVIGDAYRREFEEPALAAGRKVPACTYIPQAVCLDESESAGGGGEVPLRTACGLQNEAKVALLVAGIRAVKDPGFLLDALFNQRPKEAKKPIHLAIAGPAIDPALLESLFARGVVDRRGATASGEVVSTSCPQAFYLGSVDRGTLLRWVRESDVLLNSSLSEGQSNALLEAMALRCPIVARDVSGNRAILIDSKDESDERGFLYTTAEEAWSMVEHVCLGCERLIEDGTVSGERKLCACARKRVENAANYLEREHSLVAELHAWQHVVRKALEQASLQSPSESSRKKGASIFVSNK
jgi:glycosyltransferase involved in cell wall biosynthesis